MRMRTLVKFNFDGLSFKYHCQYPFTIEDRFVYLGDLPQMKEHCVVARVSDGRIFSGYHTWNFIPLSEEEL